MQLKKESRIFVVDALDDEIIGFVIRGLIGIEDAVIFKDCDALENF
ncbi:MAG: hypothetical protein QW632_00450 [Ignisphaera sp.]